MKYLIILGIIIIVLFAIFIQNINSKKNNTHIIDSENHLESLIKIKDSDYERYIFVQNTTEDYLIRMIEEFGELDMSNEFLISSFRIAKSEDWHIIKVDTILDFYHYHNLVGWLNGYEENINTPSLSIGYAKNISDKQNDYIFYLDPNVIEGDTEIGVFRNGNSFSIYLPEAYMENGNIKISNNQKLSINKIINTLSEEKFDISKIDLLEYIKYKIKIYI